MNHSVNFVKIKLPPMRGATGAEREGFIHRPKPLEGAEATFGSWNVPHKPVRIPHISLKVPFREI
jgi:hypothetical protein